MGGCFLGCFGSKKDRNHRRTQRYKVISPDHQRHVNQSVLQAATTAFPEQVIREKQQNPVAELKVKPEEEQLSLSSRKKVTFDSNVKTYEHIPVHESTESLPEKEKEENFPPVARSQSQSSGDDSINSGVRSFPPNHRYQNCQESDDEVGDSEYEDSGFDDEYNDREDEEFYGDDYEEEGCNYRYECKKVWSEEIPVSSEESRVEGYMETLETKRFARDRSEYIHPVLNPVENLSQRKAAKAKRTMPPSNPLKENFYFNLPTEPKPQKNQEIAVDASLSNWLPSTEEATSNKKGHLEKISSEKSLSQESTTDDSLRSLEDRPILGVLTMEEIRQFSATSSPRKSPCRSPEDMPIIGSVGSYWSHSSCSAKDSGSVSSYKGIPNTTSKYREDKKVTWHSTPFETRLERTLNRGSANA